MELFTPGDFKIFAIADFTRRMAAITLKIRPKLASIGGELAPAVSRLIDAPLFVHVARHARRTVNPPDDTWAALACGKRGYKKDVHFKISVSRHCVRFLFEAGPEYYAKAGWVREWNASFADFGSALRAAKDLCWFKDEHEEDPAVRLQELPPAELKKLGGELMHRRDGQLVFGRRVDAGAFAGMSARQVEKIALDTFKPLAPLFVLHSARAAVTRQGVRT